MPSMLEALKKAKLVDERKAAKVEAKLDAALRAREETSRQVVDSRIVADVVKSAEDEKHFRRAARESTKPSSRVGTEAYYRRFK